MVTARIVLTRKAPADLSGQRTQTLRLGGEAVREGARGAGATLLFPRAATPLPDWHNRSRETRGALGKASPKARGRRAPEVQSGQGPAVLLGLSTETASAPSGTPSAPPHTPSSLGRRRAQDAAKENPLLLYRLHSSGIFFNTLRTLSPCSAFLFILCVPILDIVLKQSIQRLNLQECLG